MQSTNFINLLWLYLKTKPQLEMIILKNLRLIVCIHTDYRLKFKDYFVFVVLEA